MRNCLLFFIFDITKDERFPNPISQSQCNAQWTVEFRVILKFWIRFNWNGGHDIKTSLTAAAESSHTSILDKTEIYSEMDGY